MNRPPFRWITAIYVTPEHSRRVVHWELYVERDDMEFRQKLRARMRELEATYPLTHFDISNVGYSSPDAMRSHHPELEIPDDATELSAVRF